MKRVSIFLITAALIAGMAGCDGYTPPPSQNLEIRTWYDLDDVRDNLEGHHTLMNDLDSTTAGYEELASPTANQETGWRPIGNPYHSFKGSIDGQGHEIHDLFINWPDEYGVGLFGIVGQEGVVENIGVVSATVTGRLRVGGLVGHNEGTVSNSYFAGTVTGNQGVGGLVGYSLYGTVSNSYSTGSVTGHIYGSRFPCWVGGLVGLNHGTVSNSYSTCSVTGSGSVGGLVGCNYASTVSNSYSTGNVTGVDAVGGLLGFNYDSTVSNSYFTGSVAGNLSVGGLVGVNEGGTVTDSYSIGNVTGVDNVGGLVGENLIDGNVSNSYSTGNVTGVDAVGGLLGFNYDSTVSYSFWDTETSGQSTSAGGTGQNTTEMQKITTFSGAGWNITAVALNETNPAYIWNIVNNVTYPFLSWQP